MSLPVFDCLIEEDINDESGIYAVSFVDNPAVEVDFMALSEHQIKKEYLSCDRKKQILTGVVLRPGQLIYRNDTKLGEYFIRFSETEIEKIACKMMKTGVALQNTTHQHQSPLKGNYLTELWIVENPENDKSLALGFDPQPRGTLMCSYKIEDRDYWDTQVMTGNVKGFSLEGLFFRQTAGTGGNNSITNKNLKKEMNSKQRKKSNTLLSKLTRFFLDIEAVEKADATGSGTAYVVFILADGKEVLADADGFVTLNGEQLPEGEHLLADGNVLVVDAQGQFTETKESAQKVTNPEEAVAPQTLAGKKPLDDAKIPDESVDTLKAKIAELESKLAELAGLAQEANAEVQKLRKTRPSTSPAAPNSSNKDVAHAPRYEHMAQALVSAIKKRSK